MGMFLGGRNSWPEYLYAITNEGFINAHGNRPFTQLSTFKEPVTGKVTKGLPQNWYDDTWYKSQSDPLKH
jgi:hypothetical protein